MVLDVCSVLINKMEKILKQLLGADKGATAVSNKELNTTLNNPERLLECLNVMASSSDTNIRHCASVIVRKKLEKGKQWKSFDATSQSRIKEGILKAFIAEQDWRVKKGLAQLIGTLARHELSKNKWPQLEELIAALYGKGPSDKEIALFLLMTMADISHHIFDSYFERVVSILDDSLKTYNCQQCNVLPYRVIMIISYLWFQKNSDKQLMLLLTNNFEIVLNVIKLYSTTDEEKAMDVLDLVEIIYESRLCTEYFEPVLNMLMEFGLDEKVYLSVRIKALYLIGIICRAKKKLLIEKQKLIPLLNLTFTLMSGRPDDDADEEYFTELAEERTITSAATQMLDSIALYMPPEKIMQPLMVLMENALKGDNIYSKKASYLVLAILAESCADTIRHNYLEMFMNCLCNGLSESAPVARNAAFFALGQFAEFLQPEVSNYAQMVIPHLVNALTFVTEQLAQGKTETRGIDKMFYAIETYCEGLGDEENMNKGEEQLGPYLEVFLKQIFEILNMNNPIETQVMTLKVLGSIVITVKNSLIPYFPQVIVLLRDYLSQTYNDDTQPLLLQAMDTLGKLWSNLSPTHLQPLVSDTLQLAVQIANGAKGKDADSDAAETDPDLRRSVYRLVSAMSVAVKEELDPYLPLFVNMMHATLRSPDGLDDCDVTDNPESMSFRSDDDDETEDLDVTNAYLEEKESACCGLKELAKNTGRAFLPYLETTFMEVLKYVDYPSDELRSVAIETLAGLVVYKYEMAQCFDENCQKGFTLLLKKYMEIIYKEEERSVVTSAVLAVREMLYGLLPEQAALCDVGAGAMHPNALFMSQHVTAVAQMVHSVMEGKIKCLFDEEQLDSSVDSEAAAEGDEYLVECAGELLPILGFIQPGDSYVAIFNMFLQLLMNKAKNKTIVGRKSFALGIMAECVAPLCASSEWLSSGLPAVYTTFMENSGDTVPDVRCNSVYGLGELTYYASAALQPAHYNEILKILLELGEKEQHPKVLDNVVGSLGRLMIAKANVPEIVNAAFPLFASKLPLRVDYAEYQVVFKCLMTLYQLGLPTMKTCMGHFIVISATVIHEKPNEEKLTKQIVKQFVSQVGQDFAEEFQLATTQLSPELRESLFSLMN